MTSTLHDQLREYGDQFRSALPTIGVEDAVGAPRAVEPGRQLRRAPQWKRGLLVTAATAVVALLLIGGSALLRSPGGVESPPATEPISTTATSPPMTATSVPPRPDTTAPQPVGEDAWTVLEVPVVGSGGFIADVAVDEAGLVAVGYECNDDCVTTSPAIWVSAAGSEWARVESADESLGTGSLQAVARGGPGWVAIGLKRGDEGGSAIAIWWSENGREWQQAPATADFTGTWRVPLGLAVADSHLIAVGTGMDESGVFGRVWSSNDGLTWTTTAELRDAELVGATSFEAGFLAVGNAVDENDNFVVAAWTSEDGTEWTKVLHQSETFGGQLGAVAAASGGAIAIGGMPDTAWVSVDGSSWAKVEELELPMETRAVLADERGFTIVGLGAWWTSADGATWQRIDEELFIDAAFGAVARTGSRLIAVGSQAGQIPTVWVQDPTGG